MAKKLITSESPDKRELRLLINQTCQEAQEIINKNSLISCEAQRVIDQGKATENLLPFLSIAPTAAENLLSSWESARVSFHNYNDRLGFNMNSTSLTSASSTVSFGTAAIIEPLATTRNVEAKRAYDNFMLVQDLPGQKNSILTLLDKLGIDKYVTSNRTPTDQFVIAFQAYENPVTETNPSATSLVPMRECIRTIINILLSLRPRQEPAGNEREKISSIGNQLRKDDVPETIVADWVEQWWQLDNKILSPSKQTITNRSEWTFCMNQAINFLNGFLDGLDREKFRK